MQVEEDPSSQFVDFTNATDSEQFVSDIEQALIAWQLSNKGHASLEALSASSSSASSRPNWTISKRSHSDPFIWTKDLQVHLAGQKSPKNYALTLFVARHPELKAASGDDPPASGGLKAPYKVKKWQEGLEHFTPTMLSVADTNRDFQWGVDGEPDEETESILETETEDINDAGRASGYYTSVFEDDGDAVFSRKMVFSNVQKWFGVDEFLFLSRSSLNEKKTQRQQESPSSGTELSVEAEHEGGGTENERSEQTHKKAGVENEDASDEDEDAMADIQVDQNEAGMLLSALTMALNNCNCTIPAFVPVHEPSRGTWIGSAVPGATGNVSISFDTDSVPELNSNQSCISGLLDFFKIKLQLPPHVEERCRIEADESGDLGIGMMVSASFGYSWNRAGDPREVSTENPLNWRTLESQLPSQEQQQIQQIRKKLFGEKHPVPLFGTSISPLNGLDLTVSWPKLREGTYVDNVVHSTLDPNSAHDWTVSARFQDLVSQNQRKPQLPLSKQIANLVQVYSNSKELSKDILVSELAPPMPAAAPPLSKASTSHVMASTSDASETVVPLPPSSSISESTIPAARAAVVLGNAISSLVSAATWKGTDVEDIRRIVLEIFGQEAENGDDDNGGEGGQGLKRSTTPVLATLPSSVQHGAPLGELVSILATRMGQLHGINSMSLLWVEFVKALRDRWFLQQLLPYMKTSTEGGGADHNRSHSLDTLFLLDADAVQLPQPDFKHCLLHQKLQLLNCCILRQAQMSNPDSSTTDGIQKDQLSVDDSLASASISEGDEKAVDDGDCDVEAENSPSDDEFFDSIEQQDAPLPSSPRAAKGPEGVLGEIPGVVCLQTNEPLLEPVTQTAVPMTEDVAKQQQDLLTRLGVSVESDKLRQQIQSTVLISDMQAFKAANPCSCLADFIRWYSPKDWLPFESPVDPLQSVLPAEGRGVWWFERHGMLSERMRFGQGHEHLWQQMWDTSVPLPASRQKRLFDPLQESEKIYHYMETLSPHELFHQMLAGSISSSVFALETALPMHTSPHTLPFVHRALQELRTRGNRAIALLDDALAESLVAFPASGRSRRETGQNEQSLAAAHQNQQLQVAFEMALDASWKFVRKLEAVEILITKALALLHYFPAPKLEENALALVNLLLLPSLSHRQQVELSGLLKHEHLRQCVAALVLTNPTLAEAGPMSTPVQREYVLRCVCPRPFLREYYGDMVLDENESEMNALQPDQELEESPLVVSRMYAAFKKSTVRFALVLAESEF
ncbi:Rab3 GTPase-activating protein catalytic subunit [Phytophthora boehmeriae]|uniref:Rab3 GTPase-activating protein catalytic subunit n=1 Tax=Phytophthora boehmeriae TaxID=109152 RepID=A0A8T1XF50_9STRA|nr:Rab3 GTPase-activating protein catalytic subunit [Phytophthora boehmeriae]